MACSQYDDDWTTVLWPKLEYMVHLGLRPWWTSRCADPPLCGLPRLSAAPLSGCRNCTLMNDTTPMTLDRWLQDSATSGGDADADVHALPWPPAGAAAGGAELAVSGSSWEGLLCPSGGNHGCCMLPTDCASGQVCMSGASVMRPTPECSPYTWRQGPRPLMHMQQTLHATCYMGASMGLQCADAGDTLLQCLGWGRGGIIGNGSLPWPTRSVDVLR